MLFKYIFDGNEIHLVIGVSQASKNLFQAFSQLAWWAKKGERKSSQMFFPSFSIAPQLAKGLEEAGFSIVTNQGFFKEAVMRT